MWEGGFSESESQIARYDVFGKATVEGGEDRVADRRSAANDVVVPEAKRRVPLGAEIGVSLPVVRAIGMLNSVDFHDQFCLPAAEICEV